MSLKKQIDDKLNKALKAKDKNTYPTLRLIVSAIKDAEIAVGQKVKKNLRIVTLFHSSKKWLNRETNLARFMKKLVVENF